MRWQPALLVLLSLTAPLAAQQATPVVSGECPGSCPSALWADGQGDGGREPLASNRNFPNFIGFMSNPLQNIDPRSLTQIVPIFGSAWVATSAALPDLDMQVYGPAISLALTDRFCVGLNQGGYAFAHIDRNDPRRPLLARLARNRGREFGGTREGFLNLGGYAQYTLIEDVESQFLATVGARLVVPCGSYEIFQGRGPALLSPYFTVGKEIGDFHFLLTSGYQFPLRDGARDTEIFYLNAHLDRAICGWIYPMVEANWSNHTTSVDVALPTRQGFINFGNFDSAGNIVTVGTGVNFVLIRDRLEFGAIYVRSVATQRNFEVDAIIAKLVLRY